MLFVSAPPQDTDVIMYRTENALVFGLVLIVSRGQVSYENCMTSYAHEDMRSQDPELLIFSVSHCLGGY